MIRFERAKGRCERCGRPHGREIQHLGDGRWWDEDERTWRNARGRDACPAAGGDNIGEPSSCSTSAFGLSRSRRCPSPKCHRANSALAARWRSQKSIGSTGACRGDHIYELGGRWTSPPHGFPRPARRQARARSSARSAARDPDEESAHPEFRMSWSGRSDDCSLVVARFLAKTYDRGKDATTRCSSASAKLPTGCR
jgi:hypothetical protein